MRCDGGYRQHPPSIEAPREGLPPLLMQACLLLAVFNTALLPALYFGHAWLIDAGGHFIHSDFATSGPRASSHSTNNPRFHSSKFRSDLPACRADRASRDRAVGQARTISGPNSRSELLHRKRWRMSKSVDFDRLSIFCYGCLTLTTARRRP
jgi:hypothetical protein